MGDGRPATDDGSIAVHQVHPTLRLDEAAVYAAVRRVLDGEGFVVTDLSIVLTDHGTVRALNRKWLGHDFDTDVVSFPLDEGAAACHEVDGEVYVDLDTAAERAPEFGAAFEEEALRYVVHGLLHLLGYDDTTDAERATMHRLEDLYLRAEERKEAGTEE